MLPVMRTNINFYEKDIKVFGGINTQENSSLGQLLISENISSQNYPFLSARKKRTIVAQTDKIINSVWGYGGIMYTSHSEDGKKIFLNFGEKEYEFTTYSSSNDFTLKRKFACVKDAILIIPDNVIFDTSKKTFKKASFEKTQTPDTAKAKFKTETGGASNTDVSLCEYVGRIYDNKISARQISYTYAGNSRVFYFASFPDELKEGDVVEIKMSAYATSYESATQYQECMLKLAAGTTAKIKSITKVSHTTPSGKVTDNTELVFEDGTFDTSGCGTIFIKNITVTRKLPNLKHICSFQNRVWGISGKSVYASKLGDASEWNDFTIDEYGTLPYASFNAEASTEGDFTAIVPFGNYIYAFKENSINKIYGDSPDEYKFNTSLCQGVKTGSGESMCIGDGSLIYPSNDGIYRYYSDYPRKISDDAGDLGEVLSGASTERYCYFLCRKEDRLCLWVYDIRYGIWHMETASEKSLMLFSYKNKVYLASQTQILCLTDDSLSGKNEKMVNWKFRMRIDDKFFNKKGYGKLMVRYSLSKNASFTVRAFYDDGGRGAICGACYDEAESSLATISLPIKRCNWFELEFSGFGDFVLKGIKLKFYRGSEI